MILNMVVPVIILNYNSSSDCEKCVADLIKQRNVKLDIIIVDNCSSILERRLLEELLGKFHGKGRHHLTYLFNGENRGYNAGNNVGLRYASSQGYKYALIANPDMEFPQSDYIEQMLIKMEQDDTIAVQGSDIVNNEGVHQNPMRESNYWEELLWPIQYVKNLKSPKWYTLDHSSSRLCEKVSGCCLMVRMSFVEQMGYFDEQVFLYSEEAILGAQVRASAFTMYYNHRPQAIHRHIEKSKGRSKPRMQVLFKSRWYYLQTYSGFSKIALFVLRISKKIQEICMVGL